MSGKGIPSGGGGSWRGHGLCTGGHDVVFGMISSQNKSGSGPPGAAHPFWRAGGVGGPGMASSLASHAGSSCGQSASAMPSARGDDCATLAVTIVKRAKEGARILHRERATTGIQSKDEVAISGNISRNLRTTGPPLGGSRKRARK